MAAGLNVRALLFDGKWKVKAWVHSERMDVWYSMALRTRTQTVFHVRAAAFVVDKRSEQEEKL